MSQSKPAISAALVVAIVLGLPVSAAAILETTAARTAREEALAERMARIAANAAVTDIVFAAADGARSAADQAAADQDVARTQAQEAAAHVLHAAELVSQHVPAVTEHFVTLAPDDSWQGIADRYGLNASELAAMNPELDLNALPSGTQLRVYQYLAERPSLSRGAPSRGRLLNGAPMPEGEFWIVRRPDLAWGTNETVSHLVRGFSHVGAAVPAAGTPMVADISRRRGGRLRPHRSHTTGRDVDVTYYQSNGRSAIWERTTRSTLDHAAQWELFRYWIEQDIVTYIFIDHRLSRSLYDYAVSRGEDAALLEKAFGERRGRGILRYSPGHDDHFHVRFRCAEHDTVCRES